MNLIAPFKLERYFAKYEFSARYLLSPSDCESMTMKDLLDLADPECISLWENLSLGYTESQGHPLLRAEISGMYPGLIADNMMVFAPQEAILVAMQSLLNPGDEVITIFPAYQSLYEIARSIGCKVNWWKFALEGNTWTLDYDWLENSITSKTRLIVINFPHNPTGHLASRADIDRIIRIADRHGVYLLCDEMYRYLEFDPAQRLPPISTIYPRGISLSGLSKAFALPGLRIGWMASQDSALVERWKALKDYTTICSSAPGEILGLIALRQKEKLADRCLSFIHSNLKTAGHFFNQFPQSFQWIPPQAGSISFPRLLMDTPIEDFCKKLVEDRNIMLVPGSIFDFSGNHFRLGLGRKNFPEALGILHDYLLET